MEVDGEDGEKDGWAGWEVDSDSDDSSSDSEGWIDVSSDGEDLELSDSDDEKEAKDPKAQRWERKKS